MRIKELKISDKTFERTINNIDYEKNDNPPKIVKLVLQIDKCLAYRVYDEFDESEIINKDKNFIVRVELPLNDWIYGYILSFGEYIKVLEPTYVKQEIIDKLNKSINNYL
ncbi:MAG: WYL domain-containing protein [Clostridia bacterium]